MAAMGMEAATTTEHHHEHGTAAAVATAAVDAAVGGGADFTGVESDDGDISPGTLLLDVFPMNVYASIWFIVIYVVIFGLNT